MALHLASFPRHNEILVENRKFLVPHLGAPVEGHSIEISIRSVYSHDRRVLSIPVGYSHDDQSEAR